MDALGRIGYAVEPLLAAAGLTRADIADPDRRVPCAAIGTILGAAQGRRFTPNLALRLAQQVPIGAFPLLDYLVVTSDSVGEGVRQLARYFRLVTYRVLLDLREDYDPIEVRMVGDLTPFTVEYTAALMVLHLRGETGGRFAPSRMSFAHQLHDVAEFERVVACPVRTRAPRNGLSVPRDVWCLPLRRRDPLLRGMLEDQAERIIARIPARDDVATGVRRALATRVAGGDTRIDGVARQLALSARTLQRRLAQEGVSYQELLDEVRREAAGQHVARSTLSTGELAYLLGYSEPALFHRAFERWFGVTPQAFRDAKRPSSAVGP